MNFIIIGNIIAFIASIIMVYTGAIKNKKKILYFQNIQIFLLIISNMILGGISGVIVNVLSLARNILYNKNKLNTLAKSTITILNVFFICKFNNLGIIGFLPLISTLTYLWLMNINDVKLFKVIIVFTMIMWFIYDMNIYSYTSAIFDAMTIVVNTVSIINLINKNRMLSK